MEIITLRMAELTPYEKNAKKHPAKVEQIKESIERWERLTGMKAVLLNG